MIHDQIGDLLTRIRNATKVRKETCCVAFSKLNFNILKIIKEAGYIVDYQPVFIDEKKIKKLLEINFKYKNKVSVIQGTRRISKPGSRVYQKSLDLPRVLNGIGIAVVSTSEGVMTAAQAKKAKLGGEVLAYVW